MASKTLFNSLTARLLAAPKTDAINEAGYIGQDMSIDIKSGEILAVEKLASLYTSGDLGVRTGGSEGDRARQPQIIPAVGLRRVVRCGDDEGDAGHRPDRHQRHDQDQCSPTGVQRCIKSIASLPRGGKHRARPLPRRRS